MFNNSWQAQQLAVLLHNQFQMQQQQQMQQLQLQQQFQQHNGALLIDPFAMGDKSCDDDGDDDDDQDADSDDKRTLFVANLDEQVTEELLYELFLQAGPLDAVRIPKDNAGRRRTFGFIVYSHYCSVNYALQLFDGLSLYRKTLTIKPKTGDGNDNAARKRRVQPAVDYDNGLVANPFKVHLGNPSMSHQTAPRHNQQQERRHPQNVGQQRREQHHSGSSRREEQRDNRLRR